MLREVLSNDGYVYCSLISLIILAFVKRIHWRRFVDSLGFLGNSNYLRIYIKEHKFFDPFDSMLYINFCMNFGAFVWIIQKSFFDGTDMTLNAFIIVIEFIALWFLLKIAVEILIGYVFDVYKLFNILSFQQISSLNYIGIILLPINLGLVFGSNFNPILTQISIFVVFLIMVIGFIKSIQSNLHVIKNNIFYFILYICALEIAPYIILFNFINQPKFC